MPNSQLGFFSSSYAIHRCYFSWVSKGYTAGPSVSILLYGKALWHTQRIRARPIRQAEPLPAIQRVNLMWKDLTMVWEMLKSSGVGEGSDPGISRSRKQLLAWDWTHKRRCHKQTKETVKGSQNCAEAVQEGWALEEGAGYGKRETREQALQIYPQRVGGTKDQPPISCQQLSNNLPGAWYPKNLGKDSW